MPFASCAGDSRLTVGENYGWPKENALRLGEGVNDFLLDASHCLVCLAEWPTVVGGSILAEILGAVSVFGLQMTLHLDAQYATAWDKDDEVRFTFHLTDMFGNVQRMQHFPL